MNRPLSPAEARDEFPTLSSVLAAYLSQDFAFEYGSVDNAVRAFVQLEPESVPDAAAELEDLLGRRLGEDELRNVSGHIGLAYAPESDGLTYRRWLRELLASLHDGRYQSSTAQGD